MQCYTCFGQGNVTCPTCNGNGSYWKVVGNKNVFEPCYQCGGKRTVQCQTCHGTGVLPDPTPKTGGIIINQPPPLLPPDPELLKLTGRWKTLGGRYELVSNNGGYRVTIFNLVGGKIGSGQGTINGNTLTLTIKTLLGTNTTDLQLSDGRLKGVMRILGGLPLPLTLTRI